MEKKSIKWRAPCKRLWYCTKYTLIYGMTVAVILVNSCGFLTMKARWPPRRSWHSLQTAEHRGPRLRGARWRWPTLSLCAHTHTHTGKALNSVSPQARSTTTGAAPRLTRVCGRDDGAKEKAVGVVELVSQLSSHHHQFDHAVHQVPNVKQGRVSSSTPQARQVVNISEGETHPIIKQEMAVPRKA